MSDAGFMVVNIAIKTRFDCDNVAKRQRNVFKSSMPQELLQLGRFEERLPQKFLNSWVSET